MNRLYEILKNYKTLIIAFSGGVDSTYLAAAAKKICGNGVIAITADSLFQSRKELKNAVHIAQQIDIQHFIVKVDIISDYQISINSRERCYFCKKILFNAIKQKALEFDCDVLAHGANIDDLKDFRPGLRAAEELNIISPLIEARLTKKEIRLASKEMRLSTWDLPSQSCLATRIPYGESITPEKLLIIEECEKFLSNLGFNQVRVRCHSDQSGNYIARIECLPQFIPLITQDDLRNKITLFFISKGIKFVSLDLVGYHSGSMN